MNRLEFETSIGDVFKHPLIIVTNREPYIHKKTEKGIRVEAAAGGVATALDDVMRTLRGVWIAWGSGTGDREVVDGEDCILVPPDNPSYRLKRVWLTNAMVENYYHGYSNRVLWPLCHIALERVYFREKYWRAYRQVNEMFAEAVLQTGIPEPVVWVHDYHLCLLPVLLRQKNPDLTIVHFWHIPWPDWSVFRVCPQAEELIRGLLGADLIGFQIPLFVKNFLDCVSEAIPEADVDYFHSVVRLDGQLTEVKAFPISIDFEKFNTVASSKGTERRVKELIKKYGLEGRYTGIGVDRLEYTKALLKRLQAIELFFEKYKSMRGRFTFVQIAASTRLQEPYLSYKKSVEKLIERINSRFGTQEWQPVVYIDEKLNFNELVAFYRLADVAIISSIYDGMNLVAKEYIASQVDTKGTLILSELAGAAEELEGAILINPYDIEGFARNIYRALRMSAKEREYRMTQMREHVSTNDIYAWISSILKEIAIIRTHKGKRPRPLWTNLDEFKGQLKDKKPFLFLDYDGTLTPIVDSPDRAVLPEQMRHIIRALSELVPVAIISGRMLEDVMQKVAVEGVFYAGNHGAEIWDREKVIVSHDVEATKEIMQDFLQRVRKMIGNISGVVIEDKGLTASIHFRNVNVKNLERVFRQFNKLADEFREVFRFTTGKKVFEVRPLSAWNKGDAVIWMLERFAPERMPIYIGDDITDEDAFLAIEGRGISISVGYRRNSDYYLKSQKEVEPLLVEILRLLRPTG